jgi:hypothetical protein
LQWTDPFVAAAFVSSAVEKRTYADKAGLFQTAPKVATDETALPRDERDLLPPTQIGRALQELQIAWIAAHSPRQGADRARIWHSSRPLGERLRLARATRLEQANPYLEKKCLLW